MIQSLPLTPLATQQPLHLAPAATIDINPPTTLRVTWVFPQFADPPTGTLGVVLLIVGALAWTPVSAGLFLFQTQHGLLTLWAASSISVCSVGLVLFTYAHRHYLDLARNYLASVGGRQRLLPQQEVEQRDGPYPLTYNKLGLTISLVGLASMFPLFLGRMPLYGLDPTWLISASSVVVVGLVVSLFGFARNRYRAYQENRAHPSGLVGQNAALPSAARQEPLSKEKPDRALLQRLLGSHRRAR